MKITIVTRLFFIILIFLYALSADKLTGHIIIKTDSEQKDAGTLFSFFEKRIVLQISFGSQKDTGSEEDAAQAFNK